MKSDVLRSGPPSETAVHLCVDMQRMFAERTEWHVPWLGRILPNVLAITAAHPERTVFTRFIPAQTPVPLSDGDRIHLGAWTTITIRKVCA